MVHPQAGGTTVASQDVAPRPGSLQQRGARLRQTGPGGQGPKGAKRDFLSGLYIHYIFIKYVYL